MSHLRLVEPGASAALAYTNRKGDTYYLHGGKTKTGKPRYFFAKAAGSGSLSEMPPLPAAATDRQAPPPELFGRGRS